MLLVGLDAACEPVLDRLARDGADLPHLRSILDEGTSAPLESQVPPWTASAWPSLYTGTNPGKHGVFGFLDFEGYDWDVVTPPTSASARSGSSSTRRDCRASSSTCPLLTRPGSSTAR